MKVLVNNFNSVTVPEAYVTKNKQRVKQFGRTVYLNNGDEFEIELVNYSTSKVLAMIEFNGNSIGSTGLVLRPGERVFLERYLDVTKKFLFETYNVDGGDLNAVNAVRNNGEISVKFYQEMFYVPPIPSPTITWRYDYTGNPPSYNPTITCGNSFSGNSITCSSLSRGNITYTAGCNTFLDSNFETGRIEQGSKSHQHFSSDFSSFNSWWTWESKWKILPHSQKPITKEDIVVYCVKCGSKRKKQQFSFCPICGNKY